MPITAAPTSTTSSPFSALAANPGNPGSMGSMPGMNLPALNLPSVPMSGVNPASITTDPSQVYKLLASQPQSLSALIVPLLAQVFGTQGNLMEPLFARQGQEQASIAQSDAMRRGLTGSSIESSAIQQAYTSANQGYAQYLAGQLNNLVPAYTGAAQFDIGQNRNYQTDLAQAIGQQLASQIQQQQFGQQLNAMLSQARMTSNAQLWSGIAGGVGAAIGGFSDIRLKTDLRPLGYWKGLTFYSFQYQKHATIPWWELPPGPRVGVLAHEAAKVHPDCVFIERGYLKVDYAKMFGLKLKEWYRA